MSDGVVLETGAENIKTYLKRIQHHVRDKVLSPVRTAQGIHVYCLIYVVCYQFLDSHRISCPGSHSVFC